MEFWVFDRIFEGNLVVKLLHQIVWYVSADGDVIKTKLKGILINS